MSPPSTIEIHLRAAVAVLTALAVIAMAAPARASDWSEVRQVQGVMVEARSTASGFDEHRGEVRVCTKLPVLEAFVADTDRFPEWLPYTRDAELLEQTDRHLVYYVRSSTPWPLKDREMVYRISRQMDSGQGVTLDLVGLPDYQPARRGATLIQAAEGRWHFIQTDSGLDVSYQLFVNPGSVPPFAANGRMASTVGKTLANLASRFPCAQI
jgi:hypothetical protein